MQHKNYDDMTLEESMKLYFQRDNNKKKISNQVINRRRINMFKMLENNDGYFSEENIKAKEPFLYEIYIGWRNRDTTHESKKGIKLSDFLFSQAILLSLLVLQMKCSFHYHLNYIYPCKKKN